MYLHLKIADAFIKYRPIEDEYFVMPLTQPQTGLLLKFS